MFSHYDRKGKCEWFEGGLGEFVSHYNREIGKNYARTECLDIVRIGGSTAKQPEVLLTDPTNGSRMVIERKSVVWPPYYILKHNNGHAFADTIWAETTGKFTDACYELRVSGRQIETIEARRIKGIAKQIGSCIAGLSSSIGSEVPSTGLHLTGTVPCRSPSARASPQSTAADWRNDYLPLSLCLSRNGSSRGSTRLDIPRMSGNGSAGQMEAVAE